MEQSAPEWLPQANRMADAQHNNRQKHRPPGQQQKKRSQSHEADKRGPPRKRQVKMTAESRPKLPEPLGLPRLQDPEPIDQREPLSAHAPLERQGKVSPHVTGEGLVPPQQFVSCLMDQGATPASQQAGCQAKADKIQSWQDNLLRKSGSRYLCATTDPGEFSLLGLRQEALQSLGRDPRPGIQKQ